MLLCFCCCVSAFWSSGSFSLLPFVFSGLLSKDYCVATVITEQWLSYDNSIITEQRLSCDNSFITEQWLSCDNSFTTEQGLSRNYRVTTVLSQRRCPDRFGLRRQRNSMRTLGKHSDNTAQRGFKVCVSVSALRCSLERLLEWFALPWTAVWDVLRCCFDAGFTKVMVFNPSRTGGPKWKWQNWLKLRVKSKETVGNSCIV